MATLSDPVIFAIAFGVTGLLVYSLLRFGPVEHSWVKVSKDEQRWLAESVRAFAATHPRSKPEGRAVYKRRMVSHEGFAVYANGIYAKWCVGKRGKYRFVPFSEVSGVYPVRIDNPFTKTDSRILGLSSWKGLQVETAGYLSYMVNSQKHDLEELVPILRRSMGPQWDRMYHPDEVIWTNFLEGNAMVHTVLRGKRPAPPAPAPSAFTMEPITVPAAEGKGALLLEEGPEDMKERALSNRRGALLLLGIGAGALVAGIVVQSLGLRVASASLSLLLWFPWLMGMFLILLAGLFLYATRHLRPIRIYDRGFELPSLLGGLTHFFSFGEIVSVTERSNVIDGETYFFRTAKPNQFFAIRRGTRGLGPVMDAIRPRFGRPEYFVQLAPTKDQDVASRKVEYALYTVGVALGVIVSVAMAAFVFAGEPLEFFIVGLGLILPTLTMLTITAVVFQVRRHQRIVPMRLNVKVPAIVIVVLLAYFFVNLGVSYSTSPPLPANVVNIGPKPAMSSLPPGVYENTMLDLSGSILVDVAQVLEIRNSTVVMQLPSDKAFGIWVAAGGTLVLEGVTLSSNPPAFGYTFEIMGSARIVRSNVTGVWGDPQNENRDGGIEVYSSDVLMDGIWISSPVTNGILVANASPTVTNSTIERAGDDGIEMHNASGRILNNTIVQCDWAMIIWDGSDPLVEGNLILDNNHGISIGGGSSPVIQNNRFQSNADFAIRYQEDSHPVLRGNVYTSNERNVVADRESFALELCGFITVAAAVVSFLVLFWVYKEGLRRDRAGTAPTKSPPSPPWP